MNKKEMQEAKKLIEEARSVKDDEYIVSVGKFLGIRQWCSTAHMELFSDAPGNNGQEKLVIYEEDFAAAAAIFANLAEVAQRRLQALKKAQEKKDADIQAREQAALTAAGGSSNTKGQSATDSA